jgi:hypothetical protein
MRSLLGLSILVAVGCSNACPAPVLCTEPHPDYCPCLTADTGPVVHPDAFVDPNDAYVEPSDDGGASDADLDGGLDDAGAADTGIDGAADDTGLDAHHP